MEKTNKLIMLAEGLCIRYDGTKDAVRDVSFGVENGDFLLVVGANGSGKSTLVKGILGLVKPYRGRISFPDEATAKNIGYLPQQSSIARDFPATVNEVVLSGFVGKKGIFSFYTKRDRKKASDIISYLGLEKTASKHFSKLSGGEKQRVLLARALVSATDCNVCSHKGCSCHDETFCHTSGLIVLDEPSNGLDPIANANLYRTLDNLRREKGMTVIMVSHQVDSAIELATKVLHMGTKMLFFGSKERYLESDISKGFVGRREGNE